MTQDCTITPDPEVDRLVRRAASRLSPQASGEVLQLGPPLPIPLGDGATPVHHLAGPGCLGEVRPVDTIVSICELWRPQWTPAELRRLAGRLHPGGRLLFVEPVAVTGASGVAQRLLGPVLRRSVGIGFDRELVPLLRRVGLAPVALDRFTVDRWGRIRSFVAGVATCSPQPGPGGCT